MLNIVDRKHGILVQKVTDRKGNKVRYQTVPEDRFGFSRVRVFDTLKDARESLESRATELKAEKA